jgi:hypothetical protein
MYTVVIANILIARAYVSSFNNIKRVGVKYFNVAMLCIKSNPVALAQKRADVYRF